MSHWTELKKPKRLLPWGRWNVLTRLWLAESRKRRAVRNESRLRSMRMARELRKSGRVRIFSRG